MDIHIFNPETDYALGSMGDYYNPPANVARLRRDMTLFPASYARPGDAIAIIDKIDRTTLRESKYYDIAEKKDLRLMHIEDVRLLLKEGDINLGSVRILPWGWNMSLRKCLIGAGVPPEMLKSENDIAAIRRLAHRRTTIPFQKEMAVRIPTLNVIEPYEFREEDEAMAFAEENPGAYFKMPWSSSGRGVICSSRWSARKLREWIHGAIARQGSVIGEHGYDKIADFATEWFCMNGKAQFAGLSWFSTSSDGNYLRNAPFSQEEIDTNIRLASPLWGRDVINAQREALDSLIAPYYSGPLGIDMLAEKDGNINPCVEINLRMTMGMATLLKN